MLVIEQDNIKYQLQNMDVIKDAHQLIIIPFATLILALVVSPTLSFNPLNI